MDAGNTIAGGDFSDMEVDPNSVDVVVDRVSSMPETMSRFLSTRFRCFVIDFAALSRVVMRTVSRAGITARYDDSVAPSSFLRWPEIDFDFVFSLARVPPFMAASFAYSPSTDIVPSIKRGPCPCTCTLEKTRHGTVIIWWGAFMGGRDAFKRATLSLSLSAYRHRVQKRVVRHRSIDRGVTEANISREATSKIAAAFVFVVGAPATLICWWHG
jgi:hypothetical protein